ncbi:hypothetical protein N825_17965 [Skermanella stibiiresistens SB22]|uniref:Uncharacterized protein n=1 Tax=Skermanella stibiiresistens SB22 TaxID=1385369 RepID=W9H171_9PROT|nr:hypothetical protein [Skermanella stibiiresistens]EWY37498.1 hypothetical protein N825_17965 [Skermanella stibiiresistens SB22]
MDNRLHYQIDEKRPTSSAMNYALNVVEAMGDTGLVNVPIKPTTAMLTAGAKSGHVSVETAWKIYQAMINEEG